MGSQNGGILSWLANILTSVKYLFRLTGIISITLVIVLLMTASAAKQAWVEQDISIFFKALGTEILGFENELYTSAKEIQESGGVIVNTENSDGFWSKTKTFFSALASLGSAIKSLWYLYFFCFLFFKVAILFTNNDSFGMSNIMIMLLILVGFELFASLVNKQIPFRGIFEFVKTIPLLLNIIYPSGIDVGNVSNSVVMS